MDFTKIIIFFIVLTIILVGMDLIVIRRWIRFVKEHKLKRIWIKVPKILFWVMLFLSMTSSIMRIYGSDLRTPNMIVFILTSLWYLPKIVIVPFLIISSIVKYTRNVYRKLILHKRKYNTSESVNTDRRKILTAASWGLATIPYFVAGKGMISTAYNFKVHKIDIPIENLHHSLRGLKIVQMSDLHLGSFYSKSPIVEARFIANELNPDIMVLTGDFVNSSYDELELGLEEFSKLKAKYGVFGCLGNHDHYMKDESLKKLIDSLRESGIDLMINENRVLEIGTTKLNLAGVDNIGMRQKFGDFEKTLSNLSDIYPTVLLCHDPTNWDLHIRRKRKAELTLAGHTHGGQIGVDFLGFNFSPAQMVYKQCAGLYSDNNQHLYVNRGLGMTGPPIRIGINPEITLLTLVNFENVT